MSWADLNLMPAMPEIALLCAVSVILVLDLFLDDAKRSITYGLSLLTLAGCAALTLSTLNPYPELTFSGMFIADPMAGVIKLAMYAAVAVTLIYSRQYALDRGFFRGEFFTLTLFSLLGMMVMVSAHHLLTLYMGLELLSLALYALVALQRDSARGTEAAMKYFVLGALASGMLLYGMSMLYGATGSLDIAVIAKALAGGTANQTLALFGLVFVFVVGILMQGLEPLMMHWQGMLVILAVLSMALGNLTAIAQTNLKRMFAYSTISHMGFLLLGILVGTPEGLSAAMFYAIIYVLMSLVGFGILVALSRAGYECETLDDIKGLNKHNSWLAFMMLLAMFSMAGIPPLAGFYAKFAILKAVVDVGLVWLAIIAVVFSLIGAFYYLRVVKTMYFDDAGEVPPQANGTYWVLSANALALLALGVFPDKLLAICIEAMKQSFQTL